MMTSDPERRTISFCIDCRLSDLESIRDSTPGMSDESRAELDNDLSYLRVLSTKWAEAAKPRHIPPWRRR